MLEFFQHLNWLVVGQIILIDILLGGDNAIVIALACRHLPPHLRMKGIVGGALGAIVLRVILIAFAVTLLSVPYLKEARSKSPNHTCPAIQNINLTKFLSITKLTISHCLTMIFLGCKLMNIFQY